MSLELVASYLFKREDSSEKKCQKQYGKGDRRCTKPTGSQTLPIVLGVCIPVVLAILVLIALQLRHVKKLKKEEAENEDIDVDVDMDFDEGLEYKHGNTPFWRGKTNDNSLHHTLGDEKSLEQPMAIRDMPRSGSLTGSFASSNHTDNPFYSNAPYLMPPDLNGSKVSLEEYSKTLNSIYDSTFKPYPNSNSLYSAPGSASGSGAASINNGYPSPRSSQHESVRKFQASPAPHTMSIHEEIPRSGSKSQLSAAYPSVQQDGISTAHNSTTNLNIVSTNPDVRSINSYPRSSMISESVVSFVSADSQIMHSAVNLASLKSSDSDLQQRMAQSNQYLSHLVNSASHGSTLHDQVVSEDEDDFTENEDADRASPPPLHVANHVHTSSVTSQGNAMVRENFTAGYGQSQTALLQDPSEIDVTDASASTSRPTSYRQVLTKEKDPQRNFSFDNSHDESDENSLDTTNGTSTNETSQDFSFEKNDEQEGELNRNDTKRFERMKSIYREYMPEGAFDEDSVPPLPRQSVKSADAFDQELDQEIETQKQLEQGRFSYVESINGDVADNMNDNRSDIVGEESAAPVAAPTAAVREPVPVVIDEPVLPHPIHAPTVDAYQHDSYYAENDGSYEHNDGYIQPPVRYSLYQESVYDNSIRDDQSVYSTAYPTNGYTPNRPAQIHTQAPNGAGLQMPRQRPQKPMAQVPLPPQKAPRPIQKLKALPNPSSVSDDLMFAPQQRRKVTGPKDITIPHSPSMSPSVDGYSPVASPVLPSPSGFRGSVMTSNLEFAPPKKYSNSPTIPQSRSFGADSRSNSMGTVPTYNSSMMTPNGVNHPHGHGNQMMNTRGSIRPDSMLVPGLDDSKMLKPQMDMTS